MTLGEIIKEYRRQHDMTMDGFAELSGISKGYISMLEKNQRSNSKKPIAPSLKVIKAVADAIGADFNTLFASLDGNVSLSGAEDFSTVIPDQAKRILAYAEQLNHDGLKLVENYIELLLRTGDYAKK